MSKEQEWKLALAKLALRRTVIDRRILAASATMRWYREGKPESFVMTSADYGRVRVKLSGHVLIIKAANNGRVIYHEEAPSILDVEVKV